MIKTSLFIYVVVILLSGCDLLKSKSKCEKQLELYEKCVANQATNELTCSELLSSGTYFGLVDDSPIDPEDPSNKLDNITSKCISDINSSEDFLQICVEEVSEDNLELNNSRFVKKLRSKCKTELESEENQKFLQQLIEVMQQNQ